MDAFVQTCKALQRRKFVRFGVPFLVLIIGGSFGLEQFASLRYKFRKVQAVDPELMEKEGIQMKKRLTLEEEYEKIKKMDIDNWENKRGPRPWEEQPES